MPACARARFIPAFRLHFRDVDIVVVRENTEDLYAGIEFEKGKAETARLRKLVAETTGNKVREDSGISLKVISETASRRIVSFAFEYARAHQQKEGNRRAQSQYHEILRWAFPGERQRGS